MVVNHNMAAICESRQLRYNVKKMEKIFQKACDRVQAEHSK